MASGTRITIAVAQAMNDALVDSLDAGSQPAEIHIFTGAPNADAAVTPAGTLLAKLICSATAFGSSSAASPSVATAASISSDTSADATGIAGCFWGGAVSVAGTILTGIIQGTAGISADTPDLVLDDKNIVIGGTVAVTGWTISMPTS